MSDSAALLKRARDLYQQGLPGEAEEIVGRMLRDNPRDATALNFRAYLLYRRGNLDDALAAYRTLADLEPSVPGHRANLGLVCFKARRYLEARQAFERLLELQPGDPKALRHLGFCLERLQSLDGALDCFTRAGDGQQAARVRGLLGGSDGGVASPAGHAGGAASPVARLPAVQETEISAWLAGACLPGLENGPGTCRAGSGGLLSGVGDTVLVNPAYCVGHRGAVTFAAAARETEKAAARLGGRHGMLARAEGEGQVLLSGRGAALHALRLDAGARLFINWAALVLCGSGIAVSFDAADLIKETFLAAELAGAGRLVLAVRGGPAVVPVTPEAPILARPGAVVAWTESVGFEPQIVPELKSLLGKAEALRYRFEGRGSVVLHAE